MKEPRLKKPIRLQSIVTQHHIERQDMTIGFGKPANMHGLEKEVHNLSAKVLGQ
jgi:hypothetical protein